MLRGSPSASLVGHAGGQLPIQDIGQARRLVRLPAEHDILRTRLDHRRDPNRGACALSRSTVLLVGAILSVAILLWSPWITSSRAESLVAEYFSRAWNGVIDGCGFTCVGCGAKQARRLIAGYSVDLEYACGLIPEDSPEFHVLDTVYVSPFGTVHGLNTP